MGKMECLVLIMSLLCTTFAIPLPQHPGFINFSYEVMTPLKWYQGLMGQQYPRYGYEPMGGWMHHSPGPMMHQTPFQSLHPMSPPLHQMQQLPPLNPHMQQPGQNTLMPQYPAGPVHQSLPPVAAEPPMHPQHPANPNQPMNPQSPMNPNAPMFPMQPLPPLMPDTPLESWPAADKTKQEEVD